MGSSKNFFWAGSPNPLSEGSGYLVGILVGGVGVQHHGVILI